jgi:hypothetical protein
MAATESITWLQFALLLLLAGNYLWVAFATSFRNFARLGDDRAVARQGLVWSLGIPALTVLLFQFPASAAGLATPLGAVFAASLTEMERVRVTGLAGTWSWACIAFVQATCFVSAVISLRSGIRQFDGEIREWFAEHRIGSLRAEKASTEKGWGCLRRRSV